MVFKIFKRSKVPDELPELASDKIGGFFNEEGKIVHKYLEEEESKNKPVLAFPEIEKPIASQKKDIKEDVSQKKDLIKGSLDNEKSFFSDLQENLSSEMNDLDQLEDWYNKKFLPRDVVSDMRGYWEKVKKNFRDPEYLLIKDECALIMGNLIHKIQNEGECKIACQNSCKIKGYFYFNSTFVSFNNQCNTCDCYCK